MPSLTWQLLVAVPDGQQFHLYLYHSEAFVSSMMVTGKALAWGLRSILAAPSDA
jgi:hypothetical protein